MEDLAMIRASNPSPDFWRGKRVLLTGHTGFKGSWLAIWLHGLGAEVVGIGLPPATLPNLFDLAGVRSLCRSHFCDIRDATALAALVGEARPEILLHLAAQPLVRAGYRDPVETFAVNVMGTVHVLDALRGVDGARVAVMVTTDKVYHNKERSAPFLESDPLGGHDPYSASKAASEIAVTSYRDSYLAAQGVAVGSARAGNVIGGGDWAPDRLIPDVLRAWQAGQAVEIRRPQATRPWQHVLEPLAGYLILAQALWERPELVGAYNFGPEAGEAASVREVVELARAVFDGGEVRYGDGLEGPYEAGWLELEIAKARENLGVIPRWALRETVGRTVEWYLAQAKGEDALSLCRTEIAAYEAAL